MSIGEYPVGESYLAIGTFVRFVEVANVHFGTECEMRTIELVHFLLGQILEGYFVHVKAKFSMPGIYSIDLLE